MGLFDCGERRIGSYLGYAVVHICSSIDLWRDRTDSIADGVREHYHSGGFSCLLTQYRDIGYRYSGVPAGGM